MADAKDQIIGYPFHLETAGAIMALTTFAVDLSTDAVEFVFEVPPDAVTLSISRVGFRQGVASGTPPAYDVKLHPVDASGNPDTATTHASGTYTPVAGNDNTWQWVNFSVAYAAAPGTYAIRISSGSASASNNSTFTTGLTASLCHFPYAIHNAAGTRTRQTIIPIFAWGTTTKAYGHPLEAMNSYSSLSSTSTPDEIGLRFTLPADWGSTFKVKGLMFMVRISATGASFKMRLYDTDGTTVLQEKTIDTDKMTTGSSQRPNVFYFEDTALDALVYGSTYRITLRLTGETAVFTTLNYYSVDAAADLDAYEAWVGGQDIHNTHRIDDGAWTNDTVSRLLAGIIISDITEPSGGGGMLVHPGMAGGARG